MSNIDAQIKALMLKKKKIDYVNYIADLVKNDTKCHDFKDVKDEVVSKIEPFLLDLMVSIESDSEVKQKESVELSFLSDEEKKALKLVAETVISKKSQVPSNTVNANAAPVVQKKREETISNNDKMNFAMNNRHLANKRVQVLNDKNAQIFGHVVGLDAPNVLVKTDTGPTIQVPIENVVPQ